MNIYIGDCIVTLIKSPEHRGLPSNMESFEGQAVKSTLFVKTKEIKITSGESQDKKFLRALKEKNPAILEEEEQKKRISMGILLVAVFNNGNWKWRERYKETDIVTFRQGMQIINQSKTQTTEESKENRLRKLMGEV